MKTFEEWMKLQEAQEEDAGFDDGQGGPRPGSQADIRRKRYLPGANTVGGKPGVTMADDEYDNMMQRTSQPWYKRILGRRSKK